MAWTLVEDTPAPFLRWQCRLTADHPDSGPQSMALLTTPTAQLEGEFGTATVELRGSNSDEEYMLCESRPHADLVALWPVLFVRAVVTEPDETTDILVTLAGRR